MGLTGGTSETGVRDKSLLVRTVFSLRDSVFSFPRATLFAVRQ